MTERNKRHSGSSKRVCKSTEKWESRVEWEDLEVKGYGNVGKDMGENIRKLTANKLSKYLNIIPRCSNVFCGQWSIIKRLTRD